MRTLRFVHRARLLGFSVADTAMLLRLWHDEARASAGVKDLAIRRATDMERRAAALSRTPRPRCGISQGPAPATTGRSAR
ncbi:MerR family DNA-binding protein [Methylobacterium oryzae CBMB20]